MYGAAGANNALKALAKALAAGVEKQLLRKALTKGTIYPIVKSVAKWFSVKMTKEVFAGFFKKAIPVVGGVIGGLGAAVLFAMKGSIPSMLLMLGGAFASLGIFLPLTLCLNKLAVLGVRWSKSFLRFVKSLFVRGGAEK